MKKKFLSFLTAFLIFGFGMVQSASASNIALSLVIDGSGSISSTNWDLQLDAYQSALLSTVPLDGTVALNLIQFSTGVTEEIPFTIIDDLADLTAFNLLVDAIVQDGNMTAIGDGITTATSSLLAFEATQFLIDWELLIDVSTDGSNNTGLSPDIAADNAITAGVAQVNAIGIGTSTAPTFNSGTDSFSLLASDFASFEATLVTKLETELNVVPEPATMLLFSFGLLGVAGIGRRKNS